MSTTLWLEILAAAVGAGVGALVVMTVLRKRAGEILVREREEFEERVRSLEATSEKEVTRRVKEAEVAHRAEMVRLREGLDRDLKDRLEEIQKLERRILQREETLDKRRESLDSKEMALERRERQLGERDEHLRREEARYKELQEQELRKLEEIACLSAEAKEKVETEAKKVLALAVERYSGDHVAESTVSVVDLPSDEMKGRIIGREGRNIRALEMATGVDIIIDDTPEAVVVSGFDKVRRETARLALEALVQDGRIHPGRIEDVVNKTKREIDRRIQEAGEEVLLELGIQGVHPEMVKLLGRLRYRTSYSQNALMHSKEVAHLSGMLASELRIDPAMAKRAGLFHDIGKAVTHEQEGSHVQLGYDIAKRYNEPSQVLNAIVSHHEDEEPNCIESLLVKAADTLSAARPGARREMVQSYIKRLEALEKIAESFKGVEKCYAIQAGREIRVAVLPDQISDSQASFLARDIAKRIESERTYPGEILVTVIRETRHTATAR
ncbi:MAG: ribonuclease Y [Candidatus Tectomicrobia bacterium]|nr:ribonuclease Y [Candidatus Tectomicrobia bacterium]